MCPDPRRFSQLHRPRTWQRTLGQRFVVQLPPEADGERGREAEEIKGLGREKVLDFRRKMLEVEFLDVCFFFFSKVL